MEEFLTFNALRVGYMANCRESLTDLYVDTKFHSNWRNFLWTDGRMYTRTDMDAGFYRSTPSRRNNTCICVEYIYTHCILTVYKIFVVPLLCVRLHNSYLLGLLYLFTSSQTSFYIPLSHHTDSTLFLQILLSLEIY